MVYIHNIVGLLSLLRLFTKGRHVINKGENSVYVVLEWLLIFRYVSKGSARVRGHLAGWQVFESNR